VWLVILPRGFWILVESDVPVPELICFNSKHRVGGSLLLLFFARSYFIFARARVVPPFLHRRWWFASGWKHSALDWLVGGVSPVAELLLTSSYPLPCARAGFPIALACRLWPIASVATLVTLFSYQESIGIAEDVRLSWHQLLRCGSSGAVLWQSCSLRPICLPVGIWWSKLTNASTELLL
jgi:hypothetical protein